MHWNNFLISLIKLKKEIRHKVSSSEKLMFEKWNAPPRYICPRT
jgi:hypothetical protein